MLAAPLLTGAACEKKTPKEPDTGAVGAADRANGSAQAPVAGKFETTPLSGIDVSKMDQDKQLLFYKLVDSLSSPCGKGEFLRASYTKDTSCKRAPFAVRYVQSLVDDEVPEADVRELYEKKYQPAEQTVKIDASKAPHDGSESAPVKLYEFFDYGCPHCAAFKPMLEQVMNDEKGKAVEYFMMFPLEKHTDSKSAAQAALAAAKQGKFKEMHDLLFANAGTSPKHSHDDVSGYAKQIGLDMAKFEADYAAAKEQVESDVAQGERAGVDSTPTLIFNDRKYEGPMHPRYIEMWIEEEAAVNR